MTTGTSDSARIYTDLGGLASLRNRAQAHDPAAAKAVAKEFESLFLQMMLKSMREASKPMESEWMHSSAMDTYRDLMDKQVAQELSRTGQLGVAEFLSRAIDKTMAKPAGPMSIGAAAPADPAAARADGSDPGTAPAGIALGRPVDRSVGISLMRQPIPLKPRPGTVPIPLPPPAADGFPAGIPLHRSTVRPWAPSSDPRWTAAVGSSTPGTAAGLAADVRAGTGISSIPPDPPSSVATFVATDDPAATIGIGTGLDPATRQALRQALAAGSADPYAN